MNPMTHDDVVDFLSAAIAYDGRNPGKSNVAAWTEAATRGRWTMDEALDALHEHYVVSAEFLMPAHITAGIRTARRAQHERDMAALLAPKRLPLGTDVPGRRLSRDLAEVHEQANKQSCPVCKRPVGQRCTLPGRDTLTRIPHLSRLTGRAIAPKP